MKKRELNFFYKSPEENNKQYKVLTTLLQHNMKGYTIKRLSSRLPKEHINNWSCHNTETIKVNETFKDDICRRLVISFYPTLILSRN